MTPEDYNFEVSEPQEFFQKELYYKMSLYEPLNTSKDNNMMEIDIFKSAEFWLSKGHGIQSRAQATGN